MDVDPSHRTSQLVLDKSISFYFYWGFTAFFVSLACHWCTRRPSFAQLIHYLIFDMEYSVFHSFDQAFLSFFNLKEDASEGHFGVRYDVMELPITLPFQKPPADKPNPKQGIGKPPLPHLP